MKLVLVVDDEPDSAYALALILDVEGFEVVVAIGGLAALEVEEEMRPNVVILDLDMPDLSGVHVAQRLRDMHRTTMLIALSGRIDEARWGTLIPPFDHALLKGNYLFQLLGLLRQFELEG